MASRTWRRDVFSRACGAGSMLYAEPTKGWVLEPLWGLHRDGGKWWLTHLPTGRLIPGAFARLADGKRFAEECARRCDCNVGAFGEPLEGKHAGDVARVFLETVGRLNAERGRFVPVPVTDRVEWDEDGKPVRFYPEVKRAVVTEEPRS